jgi:hypothetical protein
MKKAIVATVAIVCLAGLGFVAGWWLYLPVWRVEQGVRARLVDPGSAKFSHVTFNRVTRAGCGLVDAKNEMGAYVQRVQFVLDPYGNADFMPGEGRSETTEQTEDRRSRKLTYLNAAKAYCPQS